MSFENFQGIRSDRGAIRFDSAFRVGMMIWFYLRFFVQSMCKNDDVCDFFLHFYVV